MKRLSERTAYKALVVGATGLAGLVCGWQGTGVVGGGIMAITLGTAAGLAVFGHGSQVGACARLRRRHKGELPQ